MHLFTCCDAGFIFKVILWSCSSKCNFLVVGFIFLFVCLFVYLLIRFVCKLFPPGIFMNIFTHSFTHQKKRRIINSDFFFINSEFISHYSDFNYQTKVPNLRLYLKLRLFFLSIQWGKSESWNKKPNRFLYYCYSVVEIGGIHRFVMRRTSKLNL